MLSSEDIRQFYVDFGAIEGSISFIDTIDAFELL